MYRKIMCIVLCLLLLCVTSCTAGTPVTTDPADSAEESPVPTVEPSVAPDPTQEPEASDEPMDMSQISDLLMQTENFSITLMQNLKTAFTEENTLFSPLALNTSIAALYAAADGNTEEELRVMMGYTTEPEDTVSTLSTLLSSIDSDRFSLGSSLHLTKRVGFSEDYLNNVTSPLRISTYSQDYADAATFQSLNACAEVFTGGKVASVVQNTAAADTLYLLSAFNIAGTFDLPFDPANTINGTFESPMGLTNARMMRGEFLLGYAEDEYMQMISLPMENNTMQLKLILPHENGADAFDEAMIQYAEAWLAPESLSEQAIDLTLPVFEVTSSASYREILSGMGLNSALRAQTVDLSAMLNPDLVLPTPLNDIFSVGALFVSESGINLRSEEDVTPAVTEPSEESIALTFDHPFLLAVTDTQTGALLAMGWVNSVSSGR